jgi:parallel beta-helix repeat protein
MFASLVLRLLAIRKQARQKKCRRCRSTARFRPKIEVFEDRDLLSGFAIKDLPAITTVATTKNFAITALDGLGNPDANYTGTVLLSCSDGTAYLASADGVPNPTNSCSYTFTATDSGTHVFAIAINTTGIYAFTIDDVGTPANPDWQQTIQAQNAIGVALSCDRPAGLTYGDPVSFTAMVRVIAPGHGTPTGTVQFVVDDRNLDVPVTLTASGVATGTAQILSAGTHRIKAIYSGDDNDAPSSANLDGDLTVSPAALIVTPDNLSRAYGDANPGLTGTIAGLKNDDPITASCSTTAAASSPLGGYSITATLSDPANKLSNYAVTSNAGTLTVTPAELAITAGNASRTAGALNPAFTGTIAGLKNGDGITASYAAYEGNTAGAYDIVPTAVDSLPATLGNYHVTLISGILTVTPAAVTTLTFDGFPATASAGNAVTFTVTALDPYGNIAADYAGTIHFTSSDPQAALPADYAFTNPATAPAGTIPDNGTHTFSVILKTAGTQSLALRDTSNGSLAAQQSGVAVTPGVANAFLVATTATTTTAGSAFNGTLTVFDLYGNIATNYTGTAHFTSSDPQASLPADHVFSAADMGSYTFTNVILKTAGAQSLTVADLVSSSVMGIKTGLTVSPAPLSQLIVSGFPSTPTAGTSQTFFVSAADPFANVIIGYRGKVVFSCNASASLPAPYTFTAADAGKHLFTAILKTAGNRSLTVTDFANPALTGTQANIVVQAAPASKLSVAIVPGSSSTVTAGTPLAFQVTLTDPYGNIATGYTGTVHFTSSDGKAALPPDYIFSSLDAGGHTFTATLKTAGSRSLTVADAANSLLKGKFTATVIPAAASNFLVSGFPSPIYVGVESGFTVKARDPFNNVATAYTGAVHFTSSDAQAALPADYTFTAADQGVHNFAATLYTATTGTVTPRSITVTDKVSSTITGTQTKITVLKPSYSWNPSTNTITVSGLITATLSTIHAALPTAPLTLADSVNHVWFLGANLLMQDGAALNLYGTGIGGDVDQLRLKSDNLHDANGKDLPNNTITVSAVYGTIRINSTRITSWDEARNGPDINPGAIPPRGGDDSDSGSSSDTTSGHIRARIFVRSFFDRTGTIAYQSRMDVLNSDVGYLGSHATEAYGLSWKSLPVGPAAHAICQVFGNIQNSHIHHNFFGVFTYGAFGMAILNNEVDHNIWYGLDPHDDSNNLDIEGNFTHDNGTHGIILSQRCDNAIIRNNTSTNNQSCGIMLHRSSNNATVEGNICTNNGQDGIAFFESDNAKIDHNTILGSGQSGIRMSVGSQGNEAFANEIASQRDGSGTVVSATNYGVFFYLGSDTPTTGNGRPTNNFFHDNNFHDITSNPIKLGDADSNTFSNNTFLRCNNGNSILLVGCVGTSFTGNTFLDANGSAVQQLINNLADTGLNPAVATLTYLNDQTGVRVVVDATSSVVVNNSMAHVFDTSVSPELRTTVTRSGSTLTLNAANIGTSGVSIGLSLVQARTDAGSALVQFLGPREWKTTASSTVQNITYTAGGLAANTTYTVKKNGAVLFAVTTDANGNLSFADVPASLAAVDYTIT